MGKTVKFEDLPKGKLRLFGKREAVKVELPEAVQKEFGVISVEIEPMTHRDAMVREQLKSKIGAEKEKANYSVGVKPSELAQYTVDHIAIAKMAEAVNAMIPDMPESDDETELRKALESVKKVQASKEFIKAKSEYDKAEILHLQKYDDLISKIKMRDLSGMYSAECDLEENAFETVYKYVKKVTFADNVEETAMNESMVHRDFVAWMLGEIENISYLNEGEITAFQ